jgi:uncharacterized membrane protein YdjX (TVP38/TMEM64 family)
MRLSPTRLLLATALLTALGLALVIAQRTGLPDQISAALSTENIQNLVARAGLFGPLIIVGLMTLAIVASPIPSAPIAMAAGAMFGHASGTLYVMIGAEAGAIIAFGIGRYLGRDVLLKWFGDRIDIGLLGSQNALTATVFFTRLMPFISFDLVSYAAGLSCLKPWRFALATMAGIAPASFVLAHLGGTVVSSDLAWASWAILGLGLITGLPLLLALSRIFKRKDP